MLQLHLRFAIPQLRLFQLKFLVFVLLIADELALKHLLGPIVPDLQMPKIDFALLSGDAKLLVLYPDQGVSRPNPVAFLDADRFHQVAAQLRVHLDCGFCFDRGVEKEER